MLSAALKFASFGSAERPSGSSVSSLPSTLRVLSIRSAATPPPPPPRVVSLLFARSRVVIFSIAQTPAGTALSPCPDSASTPVLAAVSSFSAVTLVPVRGSLFDLEENADDMLSCSEGGFATPSLADFDELVPIVGGGGIYTTDPGILLLPRNNS